MHIFGVAFSLIGLFWTLRGYRRRHGIYGDNRWAHGSHLALVGAWLAIVGFLLTGSFWAAAGGGLFLLVCLAGAWQARAYRNRLLAKAEAEALARAGREVPALVLAAQERDYVTMGRLIANGAEVDTATAEGIDAFSVCLRAADLRGIRMLLLAGADPNRYLPSGHTPLMWASQWGKIALARLLLDASAAVDTRGHDGDTALGLAAAAGQEEMAAMLLARGARIDAPSLDGLTPLQRAAANGRGKLIRRLIAEGATASGLGDSLLALAARGGHAHVVAMLLEPPLSDLVGDEELEHLLALLEEGGDRDCRDRLREALASRAATEPGEAAEPGEQSAVAEAEAAAEAVENRTS